MIGGRKVLALIPARGGSKGIKDKNIINLCGKPLIAYTIEAAKNSLYIDTTIVTTDSDKIAKISSKYGAEVPFMRPAELASDSSNIIDAVLYTIENLKELCREYDDLVLLQPTQPLRLCSHVDEALETYQNNDFKPLVSVCAVGDHPILIRSVDDNGNLQNLINVQSTVRRQDFPMFYRVNGCIYINAISTLDINTSFNDNVIPYIMEKRQSIDIDCMEDLAIAEYYLKYSAIV